ncbi:hypothetical protein OEZ85_005390 [Tetradesmus obliquus]|uniref:Kinesin-like protein n=1 Tax=Tetradesmus obliquus TaxID=3088 RepID=A0ABY8UI84_TETOB|nr:hypothetical protein OEZ85_005390 [Tetradesmus obliquus]
MDQATVVCVRLRPSSSKETGVRCIRPEGEQDVTFTNPDRSLSSYGYDKVYGEDSTQADVFKDCQRIVSSVLNGYNGTILAYGQTGSGKTHTLIGSISSPELQGIVPRAVQALGEGIAADTSGAEYEVRLSVVETYCERIRDLLDPSRDNLQVMQSPTGAIFVDGALEAQVGSEEQLVQVMHTGLAARTVAATCMNEASSRSHCIVTVTVEKCCLDGSVLVGKLKMVDLAGSERQDKTQAAGQTLVEGSQINKSLSALANVICALTDTGGSDGAEDGSSSHPAKHVPYRDSKLTRILQDSLGGTSRTMLIICCSPCAENGPETLSSLRFGTRARGIKNKVAVNTRLSPELLQQQLAKANARLEQHEMQAQMFKFWLEHEAGVASAAAGMDPRLAMQDLVHKHKILRWLGKALSTAVQLLLPQKKQQHKQKQKHKPSQQHSQDKAASLVMVLVMSLTMFVQAWTASATSTQLEADQLQVALQVTQSGLLATIEQATRIMTARLQAVMQPPACSSSSSGGSSSMLSKLVEAATPLAASISKVLGPAVVHEGTRARYRPHAQQFASDTLLKLLMSWAGIRIAALHKQQQQQQQQQQPGQVCVCSRITSSCWQSFG